MQYNKSITLDTPDRNLKTIKLKQKYDLHLFFKFDRLFQLSK